MYNFMIIINKNMQYDCVCVCVIVRSLLASKLFGEIFQGTQPCVKP